MKQQQPAPPRIVVGKVTLEQASPPEVIAALETKGGPIRLPIDPAQLERWVMRQLRAEMA